MAQQSKLGSHMTTTTKDTAKNGEEVTVITYHKTDIVKFGTRYIVLDTGGYFTATTKTRMNQASNQFGLGYSVFQKRGNGTVTLKV